MPVSILFILIMLNLIYFCIKSKRLNISKLYKEIFFIYFVCSITINAGYAFKIGETKVAYNTVLSILLLILSVPLLLKGKFNKKIMLAGIVFWSCIGAGLLLASVFPYNGGVVQNLVDWDYIISGLKSISYNVEKSPKLFNFILGAIRVPIILSILSNILLVEDIELFLNRYKNYVPFIIGFGYLEAITKYVVHLDIYPAISLIIGDITAFEKLQGLTTEASQYALVLFICSVLVLAGAKTQNKCTINKNKQFVGNIKSRKIDLKVLVHIYILMMLNMSLTAYYLLIISIMILLVINSINSKVLLLILVGAISLVIVIIVFPDYFVARFERIGDVLASFRGGYLYKSGATSEGARLTSIYYSIKAFFARPIFGIGLGNTDAHSTFFAMIANFGLIGCCSYFYIWTKFSHCDSRNSKKIFLLIVASTLLSGGIGYFVELYFPFIILVCNVLERGRS